MALRLGRRAGSRIELTVRAADADGEVQTEATAPPAPDGATGWHQIDRPGARGLTGCGLQLDGPCDPGDRAAADPDLAVASSVMCTRPERPRTVPCRATYGAVRRPEPSSHWARAAFRLPVTGSSAVDPPSGKKARTSRLSGRARREEAGDPDVGVDDARADREDRLGTVQQHADPRRPVDQPGGVDDRGPVEVQHPGDRVAAGPRPPVRSVAVVVRRRPDRSRSGAGVRDRPRTPGRSRPRCWASPRPPARRGSCPRWGGRRTATPGWG